jgi:hypothetical protein
MQIQGIVGAPANSLSAGSTPSARMGQLGDLIVSELHGRYYEQNKQGNLYSVGMTSTALSANTVTLTATTTPIIGVWNPTGSGKNLVILKSKCLITAAGNSAVAPGGFVWATSVGNGAISNGLTPMNRSTLQSSGSVAKGFNITTALTGLTNNLTIQMSSAFGTLIAAQGATASPIISGDGVEEFDGGLIVPPGGVLALLNTVSTTTVNVASALMWEEVPI